MAAKEADAEWDETPSRPVAPFTSDSAKDLVEAGTPSPYGGKCSAASHRLVVQPRHDPEDLPHECPLCPANLCKVRLLPCRLCKTLHRFCLCWIRVEGSAQLHCLRSLFFCPYSVFRVFMYGCEKTVYCMCGTTYHHHQAHAEVSQVLIFATLFNMLTCCGSEGLKVQRPLPH